MFSGIVTATATVKSISSDDGGARISIDAGALADDLVIGGSLAVDGACLTAVAIDGHIVGVDVMAETLSRTNLGTLAEGDSVNLERPVGPSGLFEGHIVQGHIDGVATVRSVTNEGTSRRVWLDLAPELLSYVVEKGSIALDGVSLTVTAIDEGGFEVALIPHTLEVTGLTAKKEGGLVNVETDVIAKYIERLMR